MSPVFATSFLQRTLSSGWQSPCSQPLRQRRLWCRCNALQENVQRVPAQSLAAEGGLRSCRLTKWVSISQVLCSLAG